MWREFRYAYQTRQSPSIVADGDVPTRRVGVREIRFDWCEVTHGGFDRVDIHRDEFRRQTILQIGRFAIKISWEACMDHEEGHIMDAFQHLGASIGMSTNEQLSLQNALGRQYSGQSAAGQAIGVSPQHMDEYRRQVAMQQANVIEQQHAHWRREMEQRNAPERRTENDFMMEFGRFMSHNPFRPAPKKTEVVDEHAPAEKFDDMGAQPVVKDILKGASVITKEQAKARISRHLQTVG